jgi:hypothetical protein
MFPQMKETSLIFENRTWCLPASAPVDMPIELNHLDSDFCWCDPIVEVDENGVALCISRFDENRIAFYITKLAQLLSERVEARRYGRGRGDDQCSDPGTFFGCCASAMTATASSTTASRIDKRPAFVIAHTIRYVSRGRQQRKVRFTTDDIRRAGRPDF